VEEPDFCARRVRRVPTARRPYPQRNRILVRLLTIDTIRRRGVGAAPHDWPCPSGRGGGAGRCPAAAPDRCGHDKAAFADGSALSAKAACHA